MGEIVSLEQHRRGRHEPGSAPARAVRGRQSVEFFFDLKSAWTYLAAERVDRTFAAVRWTPVVADALGVGWEGAVGVDLLTARGELAERAASLRMPLIWPERHPRAGGRAMRVAAYAAECGRAAPFVLAASRLAFCGGFDPDDPEILIEAAAAAGLSLEGSMAAARDAARDGAMADTGRRLLTHGAQCLPALRVGGVLFCGEQRIPEAAAAASRRSPRTRTA